MEVAHDIAVASTRVGAMRGRWGHRAAALTAIVAVGLAGVAVNDMVRACLSTPHDRDQMRAIRGLPVVTFNPLNAGFAVAMPPEGGIATAAS